ncbi:MAG: formylmethanofuran dehydrogenase subunit C [Rubripirellula sp.]|nr:formylmethanofuran dehydrogenase subunit C [Rubripirellula sp.]
MNKIKLTLKKPPTVVLEAEVITPDHLVERSNEEIRASVVYHGKRQRRLDDFFDIEGERSDCVEIHGDLHRVRHVGRGMTRGDLTVRGDVGMHLGAHMSGGTIEVFGNAGDWVGGEMKQGRIHVHGDVGQQLGAAYRGSPIGMQGGTILIDGNAGIEVGMRMRRGTIVVGGTARDFAGLQMKGGTIILCGGAEIRTGAWMQRGTIVSLKEISLMPTFAYSGAYNPTFLNVYARHLGTLGIDLPCAEAEGSYKRFCGDRAVPGKGEILIWEPAVS